MELLLIVFYIGLFDIVGFKMLILMSIQLACQYLISPNVNKMTRFIRNDESNREQSIQNSCLILGTGTILMIYHTWIYIMEVIDSVKNAVLRIYLFKLINDRCHRLETSYQAIKVDYLLTIKQSLAQRILDNIQDSERG